MDLPQQVERYASFLKDIFFDHSIEEIEGMSKGTRDRLKISIIAHRKIVEELSNLKAKVAHLFQFKLEFDQNVQDAYAGHDTYLKFRFTNLSDSEFFKVTLDWDDPETPDELDLKIPGRNLVKPRSTSELAGAHVFQRVGIKEIADLYITVTDQLGEQALFRASPFSFKVQNLDQKITKNITTHQQISIEGRGVVDASGIGSDRGAQESSFNPNWINLSLTYISNHLDQTSKLIHKAKPNEEADIEIDSAKTSPQQKAELIKEENLFTGNKTQADEDGNIYSGEFLNGKYHGHGKLIFNDGQVYEGAWASGKMHGKGKITWPEGDVYEGDFLYGDRHGQGSFSWASGAYYEGNYLNNNKHGQGKMIYSDGNVYEGNWLEGDRQGQGKLYFVSGAQYEGSWLNDNRHGQGRMTFDNGDIYQGNWVNDVRQGQGKLNWVSGAQYEGNWLNNNRHGQGRMVYDDGGIHEGTWINDKRNGPGKMVQSDGGIYEGNYEDDHLHGYGRFSYTDGSVYEGLWDSSEWYGLGKFSCSTYVVEGNWECMGFNGIKEGKITYPNGTVYQGEISGFFPFGLGKMIYASGESLEGNWYAGTLNGFGKYIFQSGKRYEGQFIDSKFHGTGTYHFPDGSRIEGTWEKYIPTGDGVQINANGSRMLITAQDGKWVEKKKKGLFGF